LVRGDPSRRGGQMGQRARFPGRTPRFADDDLCDRAGPPGEHGRGYLGSPCAGGWAVGDRPDRRSRRDPGPSRPHPRRPCRCCRRPTTGTGKLWPGHRPTGRYGRSTTSAETSRSTGDPPVGVAKRLTSPRLSYLVICPTFRRVRRALDIAEPMVVWRPRTTVHSGDSSISAPNSARHASAARDMSSGIRIAPPGGQFDHSRHGSLFGASSSGSDQRGDP
jgi:hypothetical protein